MDKSPPEFLLARLNAIGEGLSQNDDALALISFGSVGWELDRLDQYSDLDFFVIVRPQAKDRFLADLSWLADIAPLAYYFPNTADGYKLLFADGIFCEFAVFTEAELNDAVFPPGRVVWKANGVAETIGLPSKPPPPMESPALEWVLGEALTNLYVGLLRDKRGEKLSATHFIQGYAVDRLLQLAESIEPTRPVHPDPFSRDRRFEFRHPLLSRRLPDFMQGYERNVESALAILSFLDEHFPVDPAMKHAIHNLAHSA